MFNVKEVEIKKATPSDSVIRAEISKKAFDTDELVGSPFPGGPPGYDSPDLQTKVMKIFDCYNICYNNEIIGGMVVNSYAKNHCVIESIFIDPNYHRKGIASYSMRQMFSKYKNAQIWTLGTPEWNIRTKLFYENLGFTQIGWQNCAQHFFKCRWYEKRMDGNNKYVQSIGSLKDGMKYLIVEGIIKSLGTTKEVQSKKENKYYNVNHAKLEDSTGNITLVLWNEQINEVKVGEKIRIELGSVNSYKNEKQLNTGLGVYLIHLI